MNSIKLEEKIAIVGMGCVVPDAANPQELWNNIVAEKVSIAPVDHAVMDLNVHFRPEMLGAIDKKDKTYTRMGARVADYRFDAGNYRIPPSIAAHMDDNQKIAVMSAEQALQGVHLDGIARDRISVFMGASGYGNNHHAYQLRTHFDRFEHHLRHHPAVASSLSNGNIDTVLNDMRNRMLEGTRAITEDSAPGVLPNIIAARIAAVFNLQGHAFVVDAACASALAAVICGVQHLRSGECDAVVCGAADMCIGELGLVYFSAINALSPDGSFPFDARANGFVVGQGGGAFVLKRLTDAVRSGDTVLAVICGYGQNSDGKGKAIAAPNTERQSRAIQAAVKMAGYPVDTIELIEAHGTATRVGDLSEVNALKKCFTELGSTRREYCAIGSVKSNVGHLRAAAGVPAIIKVIGAMRNRILPPTAGCNELNPRLELDGSPFYVNTGAHPWEDCPYPRRAGVSAFGFGGANYHLALQEFRPEDVASSSGRSPHATHVSFPTGIERQEKMQPQLVLLSGSDTAAVVHAGGMLLRQAGSAGAQWVQTAGEYTALADAGRACRAALIADSPEHLAGQIALLGEPWTPKRIDALRLKKIFVSTAPPVRPEQTAFLFPGQGSQYPDMLLQLETLYPSVQRGALRMNGWWRNRNGSAISELITSSARGLAATETLLKNTRHTHPALLYASLNLATLLRDMGIRPGWMVGHSAGEIIALAAAGKMSLDDALTIMDARGKAFADMQVDDFGRMLAVRAETKTVEKILSETGSAAVIANVNSPVQVILSGPSDAVAALEPLLVERGIRSVALKVSHAFHSPLVAEAGVALGEALRSIEFGRGYARVLANELGIEYPDDAGEIRNLLQRQVTGPVQFVRSIELLYAQGVRLFIEAGPNVVLSKLTSGILGERTGTVVTMNHPSGQTCESLQKGCAQLFAAGLPLQWIPPVQTYGLQTAGHKEVNQVVQESSRKASSQRRRVVYSGVSAGLPGSYKNSFQDDNFEQLFAGNNCIERLTDTEREALVDRNVTKVEKTERGPVFRTLDTLESVIQLAGKIGRIDPVADYALDPKESALWGDAIVLAVAAGFEALRDACIPLVREVSRNAQGQVIAEKWVLPPSMQERTGVIFAHGFPMVESVAAEVSRYVAHRFGSKLRNDILEFYHELLRKIEDKDARKLLTDWYLLNRNRLSPVPGHDEVYTFNHQLINQLSGLANNRLASSIRALGPNFQINAACSSTSTAITLSEEMIRSGRVDRMIVIGADNPTGEHSLPLIGAAFLSTGAATSEADLYKAALPFDKRRNGMIMSAGAVGIVLEAEEVLLQRGVAPVAELLGTHVFNTAGHLSRLDVPRYAEELETFITVMEQEHGLKRSELARELLYVSHETYTPARGGCSESEAVALRHTFGEDFRKIEVTNTKGMTGHTMGAAIEDALAAKALEKGMAPPVVNLRELDPALEGLRMFGGGAHGCRYALRMAAGFGAQGNYLLLGKTAGAQDRTLDQERWQQWLEEVVPGSGGKTSVEGRMLRLTGVIEPAAPARRRTASEPPVQKTDVKKKSPGSLSRHEILEIIATVTGYSVEMLEPDMELEADLGIDTVKQATILATLGERSGVQNEGNVQLSAYTTVGAVLEAFGGVPPVESSPTRSAPVVVTYTDSDSRRKILDVVAEVTGYSVEMLEPDMELEADLGIDTVKQATILAMLGEMFGIDSQEHFQLSAYPTLGHILDAFTAAAPLKVAAKTAAVTVFAVPPPEVADARKTALKIITEVTGYAEEMLEPDMELEADLSIDTVKQATILAMLGETFDVTSEERFQLSAYPTLGHILDAFTAAPPKEAAVVPEMTVSAAPLLPKAADTRKTVLKTIAEVTGYAEEMLELDMELEADLGVDTVKQATILSLLAERFGIQDGEQLQLSGLPTIGHVIGAFTGHEHAVATRQPPVTEVEDAAARPLQFHQMVPVAMPIDERLAGKEPARIVLIGATRRTRLFRKQLGAAYPDVLECDPMHPESLPTSATGDIWIDLGPDDTDPDDAETAAAAMEARFSWCRRIDTAATLRPRRLLAVAGNQVDGWSDFLRGFTLSLGKEWEIPATFLRIDTEEPLETATPQIMREARFGMDSRWVEYVKGERFVRFLAEVAPENGTGQGDLLNLQAEDVLLITGGGCGIAAASAKAIAGKCPCSLVLLGRTALDEEAITTMLWPDGEIQERKEALRASMASGGKRVTPVQLDRAFGHLLRQREIAQTVTEIRAMGRTVHYVAADVCDVEEMRRALENLPGGIRSITAILHAAGVDRSHVLSRKTPEEFAEVHRVKTLGAVNLARLVPPSQLRFFIAYTSISGVFGNAAQLDYAAANAFLDGWVAWQKQCNPRMLAFSIAWSGWRDIGMAWRNDFVREHADAMGLHLLEPARAVEALLGLRSDEMQSGPMIVHSGLGSIAENEWRKPAEGPLPMIERIERCGENTRRAYHTFSVRSDEFLNQHRLGDTPLLPGVGYMEFMAELLSQLETEQPCVRFRDMSFETPFKLYRSEDRSSYLEAVPGTEAGEWTMTLFSPFETRAGGISSIREYGKSRVAYGDWEAPGWDPEAWVLFGAQRFPYNEVVDRVGVFRQDVNLGPLFHDTRRDRTVGDRITIVYDREHLVIGHPMPQAQLGNPLYPLENYRLNFCLLDSIHQTAVMHGILDRREICLPWFCEEFVVRGKQTAPGIYTAQVRLVEKSADTMIYDVYLTAPDATVCAWIRGGRYRRISQ